MKIPQRKQCSRTPFGEEDKTISQQITLRLGMMLRRLLPFSFIVLLLLATACAKRATSDSALGGEQTSAPQPRMAGVDRVLIKKANLTVEVNNLDDIILKAQRIVTEVGGYIENSHIYEHHRIHLTLRVPVKYLESALDKLEELGKTKSRSILTEDVTEQAIDLEARLANLIAVRERLRKHLEHATELKDIITIEAQLTRVQGEIDSLEGRLKHLRTRVDLATINLYAERKRILGPLGYVAWALWWSISKLFVLR